MSPSASAHPAVHAAEGMLVQVKPLQWDPSSLSKKQHPHSLLQLPAPSPGSWHITGIEVAALCSLPSPKPFSFIRHHPDGLNQICCTRGNQMKRFLWQQ